VAMRHFASTATRMRVPKTLRARPASRRARSFSISETNKDFFWLHISARRVVFSLSGCSAGIRTKGFWEVLRYWLTRTELQVRANWQPYRVALLGNYGAGLRLKRDINRFWRRGPCGTAAFRAPRIEGRRAARDVDSEMIVSLLEWTVERFEDELLTEELTRGYSIELGFLKKRPPADGSFFSGTAGAIGTHDRRSKHRIAVKLTDR